MNIEGLSQLKILNTSNKNILSELSIGDLFRAKVISISTDNMLLQLMDGTTLSAKMEANTTLSEGQSLNLIVEDKVNNQVYVKLNQPNKPIDNNKEFNIENFLKEIGLESNKETKSLIQYIKNNNFELDTKVINGALTLMKEENIDIPKAVFLARNDNINNDNFVNMLNRMLSGDYKISDNINKLIELIKQPQIDIIEGNKIEIEALNKNIELNDIEIKALIDIGDKIIQNSGNTNINKANIETLLTNEIPSFNKLDISSKEQIIKLFEGVILKSQSIEEQGENLKNSFKKIENSLEKIFYNADKKEESILEIKKVFSELKDNLESVKTILNDLKAPIKGEMLKVINEVDNSIKFFNEISTYEAFVQIPLKINNQKTSGDLYIMKRKKGKSGINPNDFSLFISLNTSSLGNIDSFIQVKNKNVMLNFAVENNAIFDIIKDNYKYIYEGLNQKGFKLVDLNYRLIDQKSQLINTESIVGSLIHKERRIDLKIWMKRNQLRKLLH